MKRIQLIAAEAILSTDTPINVNKAKVTKRIIAKTIATKPLTRRPAGTHSA